jgi:hypothetical protein
MKMYQRVACVVLAGLLLAPPSNNIMLAGAIALLGLAFLVPSKEMKQ